MILLVDDDANFLAAAEPVIGQGREVLSANNGAQAMGLLDAIGFSIALVDLNLPDCSGFDLIQQMHKACPELPIIAISGVSSRAVLESAKEIGASEILAKPPTREWKTTVERLRLPTTGPSKNS